MSNAIFVMPNCKEENVAERDRFWNGSDQIFVKQRVQKIP
jgi:hypothetical protein